MPASAHRMASTIPVRKPRAKSSPLLRAERRKRLERKITALQMDTGHIGVLGLQKEAEQWLERPAISLNNRRPIDLLTTPAGVELVEDILQRLEYGVYT